MEVSDQFYDPDDLPPVPFVYEAEAVPGRVLTLWRMVEYVPLQACPARKPRLTAVGIRCADHAPRSIRRS
jgi:hypothetical protein